MRTAWRGKKEISTYFSSVFTDNNLIARVEKSDRERDNFTNFYVCARRTTIFLLPRSSVQISVEKVQESMHGTVKKNNVRVYTRVKGKLISRHPPFRCHVRSFNLDVSFFISVRVILSWIVFLLLIQACFVQNMIDF